MVTAPFVFSGFPRLHFGAGRIQEAPDLALKYGKRALLVTGARSFRASRAFDNLIKGFGSRGITIDLCEAAGEPSPEMVDEITAAFHGKGVKVVVAVGGGSVIDAAKAVSAMLPSGESVSGYLEGVGKKAHDGRKVPMIAVPTTAGTGSEATKNAVLSRVGEKGFKRSLRHDHFVPDIALVDPELARSCPPETTAACGMDALSQLIESYVSKKSNPVTDALAEKGMSFVGRRLPEAFLRGNDLEARSDMALAAFLSGVTLTQAGLCTVHGFASSVGGRFPVPHGVLCGHLLAPWAAAMAPVSGKLAEVSRFLGASLEGFAAQFHLPALGGFGIRAEDVDELARITEDKNNPVPFSPEQKAAILRKAVFS